MTSIKKQIYPSVFVIILFGFNTFLWITYMNSVYLSSDTILTAVLGSSLIVGFSLVFFLATRNRLVVRIFGGLENLYIWHRMMAVILVLSIFIHGYFAVARGVRNIPDVFLLGSAMEAGETARNIFLILVSIALLAKFMQYEIFRYIHRLLIIPFIFALYHGFFTSIVDLFSFNYLSIWMLLVSIVGIFSSFYMIFIYQRTAFKYKGEVVDRYFLNNQIIELKVLINREYKFKPGQFAFIKIYTQNIKKEPHPFSISGFDGKYVYFTIKTLGDYTESLVEKLDIPAKIKLTRPFGNMTFDSKTSNQLWVAGGIGITPFLGYLRTNETFETNIHMIYSVRSKPEAVHLDQLKKMTDKFDKFSFSLHDTANDGFLTVDQFDIDDDTILYMCGPRPMVLALKKQMKDKFPKTIIIYEAFSFTGTLVEDIFNLIKKFIRSIKR